MSLKDISEHPPFGKTLRVFQASPSDIDRLYDRGKLEVQEIDLYPNQPLILKSQSQSALALAGRSSKYVYLAHDNITHFNVGGRNKEQVLLLNILDDPDIRCVVVTGAAGTGKTTCIGGYALEQVLDKKSFDRLILSKPMEVVGGSKYWGTTPGPEEDKFAPFIKSFKILFQNLAGENGSSYIETAMGEKIEFMPLELMRGASLRDCICWYDEAQNLNEFEALTLGTRLDDTGQSKLILSGDMAQRDRRIKRDNAGLYQLIESEDFKKSPHTAHVNLIENERGDISQLFHDVFDDTHQKGDT